VQHATHESLLQQFEHDLDSLGHVELHAGVATAERRTLLDCVPVEKLRAWKAACEKSHTSFRAKVLPHALRPCITCTCSC
jgi:hypothetical protein